MSLAAARDDYGVILVKRAASDGCDLDEAATAKLRAEIRASLRARHGAPPAMIDRGPGYEQMTRGEGASRGRKEA